MAEKYWKQQKQKEFDSKNVRELRHEMGALDVLAKEMKRHAGKGRFEPEEFDELFKHLTNADKVSKRLGLRVKDPPFELVPPTRSDLSKNSENEPALLLAEVLLDELSWHSRNLGSYLSND